MGLPSSQATPHSLNPHGIELLPHKGPLAAHKPPYGTDYTTEDPNMPQALLTLGLPGPTEGLFEPFVPATPVPPSSPTGPGQLHTPPPGGP